MYPTTESKADVDALFVAFASSGAYATFVEYLEALLEKETMDLKDAAVAAVAGDAELMKFAAFRYGRVQFLRDFLSYVSRFKNNRSVS